MKVRHIRRMPRPARSTIQLYPYQRRVLEMLRKRPRGTMVLYGRMPGMATIRRALR